MNRSIKPTVRPLPYYAMSGSSTEEYALARSLRSTVLVYLLERDCDIKKVKEY